MYHPRGGRARLPAVPGDRRRRRRAGGARSRQPSVSALPALWTPGAPRPPRLAALPALRPAVPPQREPRSLILRQIRRVDPARLEQAAQLSESRHLELPHALAAEREPLSDRLQRFRRIALEPEAPPQHRALVGGVAVQSAPTGASSETGCWRTSSSSAISPSLVPSACASSSVVGGRPSACVSRRCSRT